MVSCVVANKIFLFSVDFHNFKLLKHAFKGPIFDYEYLREFDAEIGTARKVA